MAYSRRTRAYTQSLFRRKMHDGPLDERVVKGQKYSCSFAIVLVSLRMVSYSQMYAQNIRRSA